MRFDHAVDWALEHAMARDRRIVVIGEDIHMIRAPLYTRFGRERVLPTPISESAFVGAAYGAALGGLRPVVELVMVDFVGVAMDALLNHIAKLEGFTGGRWRCPLLLRAPCGGGYGDGGQHEQALWGMIGGIPGLVVAVPSTPADAAGLMTTALAHDGPVVLLEHKLLSDLLRTSLGGGQRPGVRFDVPEAGRDGHVPHRPEPVPFGRAAVRREGRDVTVASLAVGVHRALEAAERLASHGISAEVVDLRTVRPLPVADVARSVRHTGRLVVVDEDYREMGLSGELAAELLEQGLRFAFRRVCLEDTLPFARRLEREALPHAARIVAAVESLVAPRGAEVFPPP